MPVSWSRVSLPSLLPAPSPCVHSPHRTQGALVKTSVRPCYPPAHLLRDCQLPLSWEPHSVQGCAGPSRPAPPALQGLRSSLPSPAEFQPRASTHFLRHTRVGLHTQYSRTGRLPSHAACPSGSLPAFLSRFSVAAHGLPSALCTSAPPQLVVHRCALFISLRTLTPSCK